MLRNFKRKNEYASKTLRVFEKMSEIYNKLLEQYNMHKKSRADQEKLIEIRARNCQVLFLIIIICASLLMNFQIIIMILNMKILGNVLCVLMIILFGSCAMFLYSYQEKIQCQLFLLKLNEIIDKIDESFKEKNALTAAKLLKEVARDFDECEFITIDFID